MRLWTWQKEGFDIRDKNVKVESLKNSLYLNDSYISKEQREIFKKVYTKIYEKLGTCQFHWYFTEEDEAKREASHLEFSKLGRVLWEIEVPVGKVFKRICNIAWSYLLQSPGIPSKLSNYWKNHLNLDDPRIEPFEQNFHDFWKDKSEEELWDLLFLEKYVDGCTDVLLSHPLEKSWIRRNPIEEDKWWEITKGNQHSKGSYTCTLPCYKCSGHSSK